MCGSVVLTVSRAEPLLLMLMSACALSGDALLTASFVEAVLTCLRVLPPSALSVASCATGVVAPLPLLALGVPTGRGCSATGTLPGPWRPARCAVVVAWSFIPGRVCCGISCAQCLRALGHMRPSSRRVMMPRLLQRSIRTVLNLVPSTEQVNMTALPDCLPFGFMAVHCHHRRMFLTI